MLRMQDLPHGVARVIASTAQKSQADENVAACVCAASRSLLECWGCVNEPVCSKSKYVVSLVAGVIGAEGISPRLQDGEGAYPNGRADDRCNNSCGAVMALIVDVGEANFAKSSSYPNVVKQGAFTAGGRVDF